MRVLFGACMSLCMCGKEALGRFGLGLLSGMFGFGLLWGCLGLKVLVKKALGRFDCFGGFEGSGKKGFWDAWGRLFFGGEMPAASAMYIRNMDIPNMDIPNPPPPTPQAGNPRNAGHTRVRPTQNKPKFRCPSRRHWYIRVVACVRSDRPRTSQIALRLQPTSPRIFVH